MTYSTTAHTLVWLAVLGLVLSLDGLVVGSSIVTLAGAGLAVPAGLLARLARRSSRRRRRRLPLAVHRASVPALIVRQPLRHARRVDVSRWENEGGARYPA